MSWADQYNPPKQRRVKDKDTALIRPVTVLAHKDLDMCDSLADFEALEHSSKGTPEWYRPSLAKLPELEE